MKKLIFLSVLALAIAFVTSAYAEVQNVKVGGNIRIRPYYSNNLNDLSDASGTDYGFIQQRTRVIVEADLTDNVAVNASLEANGLWGDTSSSTPFASDKDWNTSVNEAWVQLSELYYTPLTLKLGRQYLNYGTGFIISSAEYENNFDAARAVLNFEPWTIDLVYSKLLETSATNKDLDLWGGNARYAADKWNIEGYFWGLVKKGTDNTYLPGIRGDITPIENLDLWGEFTYAFNDGDMDAIGANLGAKYQFANTTWKPTIGLAYAYGAGDKAGVDVFPDTAEYNYYGYAYSPALSNIHIFNANLTVQPVEKLALTLDYYHYLQDEKMKMNMADSNQDNGGISALTNGTDDALGDELDIIANYDYTQDVSTQLYLAWFMPGDAYSSPNDDDAYEIRGEIVVSF